MLRRSTKSTFSTFLEEKDKKGSVLGRLKFKKSKEQRMKMLQKANKSFREQSRLQGLLDARRNAFHALPADEQHCLRNAFLVCDKDESGALDLRETKKAMLELGLTGKTDAEKKDIAMLLQEFSVVGDVDFYTFCFELVPQAREKLNELRRGNLLEQFCAYDADASGLLDEDECAEIIGKLCQSNMDSQGFNEISTHGSEIFEIVKQKDTGQVDFEGFITLIGRVREKHERVKKEREQIVIKANSLDDDEVLRHSEEILTLHQSFSNQDEDGSGGLDDKEIVGALLEYGLVPKEADERAKVEQTVKELADARGEGMSFHDFLWLIRHLREEATRCSQYEHKKMFDRYDADKSGNLSLQEVSLLIVEVGLTPRCREDQDEIKKLLQEVDADGSGEIDFEEFQELVQAITEKMRSGQRRRENETAKRLGFSTKQIADLRDAFFQLDESGDGELSIDECRQTLTLLRKNMSSEDLHAVFDSIDRNGSGHIDFEEFLHFWKSVEDPEFFNNITGHY